jgi:hypothetical protein
LAVEGAGVGASSPASSPVRASNPLCSGFFTRCCGPLPPVQFALLRELGKFGRHMTAAN